MRIYSVSEPGSVVWQPYSWAARKLSRLKFSTHIMVKQGTVPADNSLTLYSSFDGGVTSAAMFTLANTNGYSTSDGVPSPGSTLDYNNPRVESPSCALSPVPTWQQFFDGPTQELMFFSVPVIN